MQLIQTLTVGSGGAASITFGSGGTIPADYTDLLIVYSLRLDATEDYFGVELNGSASNFTLRNLFGAGTGSGSSDSRSDGLIGNTANKSSFTANTFSNGQLYIPNYRSSANKSLSNDTVTENNATEAGQRISALLWSVTDPITSVTLNAAGANNFVQYSSASLYGILKGSDGIVSVS